MTATHSEPVHQRVAAVTGATGAIGQAIAQALATPPQPFAVVLVCRDEKKAKRAVADIVRATDNPAVRYELADLSRLVDIERLVQRWSGPLHVLINNAASAPRERTETPEGIELQFAANVLSQYWMTTRLADILAASAPARVIQVSSYWAGDLDLDDLEFKRRPYDNDQAYRQSKQANRMLAVALAEALAPRDITVNACHPGDVDSRLSNDLYFAGDETPEEGARTPVWLARSEAGATISGGYFSHQKQESCPFAKDRQAIAKLYARCQTYGG